MDKPFDVEDLPALRAKLEADIANPSFGGWWVDADGFPVFVRWTSHSSTLRREFELDTHEDAYERGLIRFSVAASMSTAMDPRRATRQAFRTISLALNLMGASRYADRKFEASDDRPWKDRDDKSNFLNWNISGKYPEDIIRWLRRRAPDGGFRSHTGSGYRLGAMPKPASTLEVRTPDNYSRLRDIGLGVEAKLKEYASGDEKLARFMNQYTIEVGRTPGMVDLLSGR